MRPNWYPDNILKSKLSEAKCNNLVNDKLRCKAGICVMKKLNIDLIKSLVFLALKKIEKICFYYRGKGYGGRGSIKQEIRLINRLLDDNPVIAIDIGGNVGDFSAELRYRYNNIEIHTFEPSLMNIAKLNDRFKLDHNIKILPYAISNENGKSYLHSNYQGSRLASLTKRRLEYLGIDFNESEIVDVMRFDDYWVKYLSKRIVDIVKLDVEGHELAALEGFGEAITSIKIIQFEFGGCNIDTRTYFRDFWYFFEDKKFDIFRITPIGFEVISKYSELEEFFSTTNYIAKNKYL